MNTTTTTTIVAQFVNQPRPGRKNGTIKTPDETLYLAKPDVLAKMQQGGQYRVTYDEYTIGGNQFKEIKSVEVLAAPAASAASAGASPGKRSYPQDDQLAERIFVCGIMNAMMNNPNVKPYEIEGGAAVKLVEKWRKVFALTFGKAGEVAQAPASAPTSLKDDLNDEIPW